MVHIEKGVNQDCKLLAYVLNLKPFNACVS